MSERILAILDSDGLLAQWIREHLNYPHRQWCLIWPFGRNQGGYANYSDKGIIVSRLMCEWRNGPQPDDKPDAAHECGKGRDGCVNPWHVVWKSHGENIQDTYRHGRDRKAKLTPEQVDEIRALEGRMMLKDIAERYGVTDVTIRQIHRGQIWKKPSSLQTRIFSEEEVLRIRASNQIAAKLAAEFSVSTSIIYRIKKRKTYKYFDDASPVTSPERRP